MVFSKCSQQGAHTIFSSYMHNSSCPPGFLQFISLEFEPIHHLYCHGVQTTKEEAVMFLLHASTFLSSLLIVVHLISFLLTRFFTFLLERAETSKEQRVSLLCAEDEIKHITDDSYSDNEELAAGIFSSEEGLLFSYKESIVNDALLVEEEKDSDQQHHLLEVDESFAPESPYTLPLDNHEKLCLSQYGDVPATSVLKSSDSPLPIICEPEEDCGGDSCHNNELEEAGEVFSENEKLVIIDQTVQSDSKKFQLEEDKETFGGCPTDELTSDSETECPFSSSSLRSSSNWETYALFQKYDEEMMFFDRISAQNLAETESFRSIKFQPRSISQRLVRSFTTPKKEGGRDPYQELESAYVAQICLAWEALNWNYKSFRERGANGDSERSFCTAWIAQQFQKFQVLLQRFIENEPYEHGRRPEIFARMRISSPKLLQVPELREADEGGEGLISSTEYLAILKAAIRTFMNFLKADKQNPRQMLKAFIKKKSGSVDPNLLHLLKRSNKKKKMSLNDLLKQRRSSKKKWLKKEEEEEEEEMEILMGLIDMKIVSRTLRMPEISRDQLHWCEEKMNKVRVWDGKVQRDSSPLFSLFTDPNLSVV